MRTITVSSIIPVSLSEMWDLLTTLDAYPKYVKYSKRVKMHGEFEVGTIWDDLTTIVVFPLNVAHEIITITPKKELVYKVNYPFGGVLFENFNLERQADSTKITVNFSFHLGNKIFTNIFGPILAWRLKDMIVGTIDNFKRISF